MNTRKVSMWPGKGVENPVQDECNRGQKRKPDLQEGNVSRIYMILHSFTAGRCH